MIYEHIMEHAIRTLDEKLSDPNWEWSPKEREEAQRAKRDLVRLMYENRSGLLSEATEGPEGPEEESYILTESELKAVIRQAVEHALDSYQDRFQALQDALGGIGKTAAALEAREKSLPQEILDGALAEWCAAQDDRCCWDHPFKPPAKSWCLECRSLVRMNADKATRWMEHVEIQGSHEWSQSAAERMRWLVRDFQIQCTGLNQELQRVSEERDRLKEGQEE